MRLDPGAKDRGRSNMLGIFNNKPGSFYFVSSQLCDPKHIPSPSPPWALGFPLETPGWSKRSSESYCESASLSRLRILGAEVRC